MKWTKQTKKIKDIKEFAKNPRYIKKDEAQHLTESLEKFGQCEPIIVNVDGTLIGGHQRLRILRKMGQTEVEVSIPDRLLTDKEVEELNIRLNKNTGEFDFDILGNLWNPENLVEFGFLPSELGIDMSIEDIEADVNKEEDKKKNSSSNMVITFKNSEDLQKAENRISTIVDEFDGAKYKIKI